MGDSLVERVRALRRIGNCRRSNPRQLDFTSRSNGGAAVDSRENAEEAAEAKKIRLIEFLRVARLMNKQFEKDRPITRAMPWDGAHMSRELLLTREWIVTNGLGGYASGTVSGAVTRRYHGLLIAALPAPLGRVVMWSHVSEFLRFRDDDVVSLGAEERAGGQLDLQSADFLREFRLEDGLPVWIYHVRDLVLEKRVLLPHLQNTVHVSYQVIAGTAPPRFELRPAFHFRHHESPVDTGLAAPYKLTAVDDRYEIAAARRKLPPLRMRICGRGSTFTIAPA